MKILLVSDYGTPTGGAELMMLSLRDGLRQKGHDARFFTTSAQPGNAKNLADYQCFGTTSSFRTLLQTANPFAFQSLERILNEFQPDVVHVRLFLTQLSPLILPLLRDIPSLYHVAWYRAICPLGTKMLPNGKVCNNSVGSPCYKNQCLPFHDWLPLMLQMNLWEKWRDAFNLIVANSEAVKRILLAQGIKATEVVWNGIPVRPPRPTLDYPPTVAFAGRLVWEKGVDTLIRAIAKLVSTIPDTQLLIAGEGPESDNLTSQIQELGIEKNIRMLGHLSRSQLEQKFASAWVQVVPSRWAEPFGIVATEAMMRGTAVIATSTGGLAEIVQHNKTGFLIPPDDVNALCDKLLQLLNHRELAEEMGKNGREIALANFSQEIFLNRFIDLYKKLCAPQ
jgi:glycosyltransferase involved in cell wall biosynthesis